MTDGEMLKLILDKVTNLESGMHTVNGRLDKMENRLDKIEDRLDKMEDRLDKLESEVSALKTGQADIRKDIKRIDQKVSDTYNLALETWGTSVENRKWLETLNG